MIYKRARGVAGGVKRRLQSWVRAREGYRYGKALQPSGGHAPETPPNELETYFNRHTEGPGLWKWRHYFPIYDRHFRKFVGREVQIVEIGVFSGGSIDMWKTYFGDGAYVYGVDIEPACKAYEAPGTSIFIGDQADPAFWREFLREVPAFDIVVDDGGHAPHQQVTTLQALLPHVRPGGVYLCEDIQGPSHAFHGFVYGLTRNLHDAGPYEGEKGWRSTDFQRTVDSVHLYPFVTVIEKRASALDWLVAPKHGTQWQPFYEGQPFPTETDAG